MQEYIKPLLQAYHNKDIWMPRLSALSYIKSQLYIQAEMSIYISCLKVFGCCVCCVKCDILCVSKKKKESLFICLK